MNIWTASRPASTTRLKVEFVVFYLLAPVLIAMTMPATVMFPALFALTLVGLALLNGTEGFDWRDLVQNLHMLRLGELLGFTLIVFLLCTLLVQLLMPTAGFDLLSRQPLLLLGLAIAYPLASVLPQELVFRPLFFRRYGRFLPPGRAGLLTNAGLFALAHLLYWSWLVALMTFVGGLIFAWAYEIRRSFVLAVVLHSLAGLVIFAAGLGLYFYSGNVQRPF